MKKKELKAYWDIEHNLRSNLSAYDNPPASKVCDNIMETIKVPKFSEGASILEDDVRVRVSNLILEEAIKKAYMFGISVGIATSNIGRFDLKDKKNG